MKNRLIIIDGPSTVGKSSISKGLYMQLVEKEKVSWLHEECENHPIRDNEFEAGDTHTREGMELNRIQMLKKWEEFRDEIIKSDKRYITEGCFLHSLDRYLLESVWNAKEIEAFYHQIMDIIRPLNPFLVFLYRPDLQKSFEKAFVSRGEWWKNLVLGTPEPYGYFETHPYDGDESVFKGLLFEQEQMKEIFTHLHCDKLMIDTSKEDWGKYISELTEKVGYQYHDKSSVVIDSMNYCGTYKMEGADDLWEIRIDSKGQLFSSLFWPYMPMTYVGNHSFEFISFPIRIVFETRDGVPEFSVEGNYDWKYNGRRFIQTAEKKRFGIEG